MIPERPLRSPLALRLGTKSSCAMADSTFDRVLALTGTVPVTTFETVFVDTPARAATSFIVARGGGCAVIRSA